MILDFIVKPYPIKQKLMKAYTRKQYAGPEVLTLSELPMPMPMPMPKPKANEVLIKVKASSINPAD